MKRKHGGPWVGYSGWLEDAVTESRAEVSRRVSFPVRQFAIHLEL